MHAAPLRRRLVLLSAALLAGAALFFVMRDPPAPLESNTPPQAAAPDKSRPAPPGRDAEAFTPPLELSAAAGLSTADIALQLAGWPEGKVHADLPRWAALLAARGPDAVNDLGSALATAGSNTARGVLADSLARIGTDNAIQELSTCAVQAPDAAARQTVASAFRAVSRPAAVPMLASLFAETDPVLAAEAAGAVRRLADQAGVLALADLAQEGGQLHSQREIVFNVLSTLQNPEALPALEAIAADNTDPERAAAARAGIAALNSAPEPR
jgi:hypothetical protein